MAKRAKTNAVRLLEAAKISFELIEYPVDESDLAATHIAEVLDEDIKRVFKTLVLKGERNGYFVCVIPGDDEVDLKKAAAVFADKKADLIAMKDLLAVTGYIRGGCSPVGMKKPYPIYFHNTAVNYDYIYVSAGCRGMQFKVNPQALIGYVGAKLADIIK